MLGIGSAKFYWCVITIRTRAIEITLIFKIHLRWKKDNDGKDFKKITKLYFSYVIWYFIKPKSEKTHPGAPLIQSARKFTKFEKKTPSTRLVK
jgi:hypothetical protein